LLGFALARVALPCHGAFTLCASLCPTMFLLLHTLRLLRAFEALFLSQNLKLKLKLKLKFYCTRRRKHETKTENPTAITRRTNKQKKRKKTKRKADEKA